jgi:hypothetical protein
MWRSTSPTTDAAEAIMREGFRDATDSYMLANLTLTGVLISDVPLDINEGATGEQVIIDELPDLVQINDHEINDHELVEEANTYREWRVPASLLNRHARLHLAPMDDA